MTKKSGETKMSKAVSTLLNGPTRRKAGLTAKRTREQFKCATVIDADESALLKKMWSTGAARAREATANGPGPYTKSQHTPSDPVEGSAEAEAAFARQLQPGSFLAKVVPPLDLVHAVVSPSLRYMNRLFSTQIVHFSIDGASFRRWRNNQSDYESIPEALQFPCDSLGGPTGFLVTLADHWHVDTLSSLSPDRVFVRATLDYAIVRTK